MDISFINMTTEDEIRVRCEFLALPQRTVKVRPGGEASRNRLRKFLSKASPQDIRVMTADKRVFLLHPDVTF